MRILSSTALLCLALPVAAQDSVQERAWSGNFDIRHEQCLESIAVDPEAAYEDAMIWRGDGGGRRARHCEAMALFALGHEDEAAFRLDALAASPAGGTEAQRVNMYSEAAQGWLLAGEPRRAWESASNALEMDSAHVETRITRARAYAAFGRFADAETDLTSVLAFAPDHADALRYRADVRLRQDDLDAALADAEASLSIDPKSVDTALIRGRIREAIRSRDTEPN